jgi:hypothetical protein
MTTRRYHLGPSCAGDDIAEVRRQINQILETVKSTVPQEK